MHRQGSQVWGGEDKFERLVRFAHPQVLVSITLNSGLYYSKFYPTNIVADRGL